MNAHIFTPQDDSLHARIQAYQRVVRDYRDFLSNCASLDNETLGETADIDQARQVFFNSLKLAQQAVDSKDLQQAQSQGLISDDDIRDFVQTQRTAEIEAKRNTQQSNQSQHKQRRQIICFFVVLIMMNVLPDNQITMSKTVQLHPDELMQKTQKTANPIQLDLFQTIVNHSYSNSVELYQTLPDVFAGKQNKLRNPDWTLPVLVRQGMYNQTPYTLAISPANVSIETKGKRTHKAFYKTVVAEFIEHALHKLSIADGFFLNNDKITTDDFGFITTLYQIREELKRMGKTYSYEQIKEGLQILAWLRYEITGDINKNYGIGSVFSPIDLTIKYDKANPNHSQVYVRFNSLISKRILALDWRGFNYNEFMKLKTSFGRAFFMRLSHRFTQADSLRGYHFKLTTLIAEWVLQADKVTTNIKKINEGLKDCAYIIDHYDAEEIYTTNPQTNRRQLTDYKVTVYPTDAFQKEQYRTNVHQKNLANHRIDEQGKPIIKPMRDQYPTRHDFDRYINDTQNYKDAKIVNKK